MLTIKKRMALETSFGIQGASNSFSLGKCHVACTGYIAVHPDFLLPPCQRWDQRRCLRGPTASPSGNSCAGAGQCPAQQHGSDICVRAGGQAPQAVARGRALPSQQTGKGTSV